MNVGSVGYPRVETTSVYCLFDTDAGRVEFRRLPFDYKSYVAFLHAHGIELPLGLDNAY